MNDDLALWRATYDRMRIANIPVFGDSKLPVCEGWHEKTPGQQWNEAGNLAGNLAILGGGPLGLAMIDPDSRQTVTNVKDGLTGLGYPLLFHSTAHAGRARFLMRLDGVPESFTWGNLPPALGPGELRFNAPAVAPHSRVDGRWYQFDGGIGDVFKIPSLPIVRFQDVSSWLMPKTSKDAVVRVFVRVPVKLLYRPMPGSTAELLCILKTAEKARAIKHHGKLYRSRSEAESGVMGDLILCAWKRDAIYQTFAEYRPGHYVEVPPKHAERYLDRTYQNVLSAICATEARRKLADCWQNALQRAWPGNGGALERRVYLAVVSLAWQRGKTETRAALRDICDHAACSIKGAFGALRRLADAGLLVCVSSGSATDAGVWRVVFANGNNSHKEYGVNEPNGTPNDDSERGAVVVQSADAERLGVLTAVFAKTVTGHKEQGERDAIGTQNEDSEREIVACESADAARLDSAHLEDGQYGAELFTPGILGRSAGLVYARLGATPLTPGELASLSGKHLATVYRVLNQLESDGLARREGNGWVRGSTSVTTLETMQSVRCDERQAQRRKRIEAERVAWAERLGKG